MEKGKTSELGRLPRFQPNSRVARSVSSPCTNASRLTSAGVWRVAVGHRRWWAVAVPTTPTWLGRNPASARHSPPLCPPSPYLPRSTPRSAHVVPLRRYRHCAYVARCGTRSSPEFGANHTPSFAFALLSPCACSTALVSSEVAATHGRSLARAPAKLMAVTWLIYIFGKSLHHPWTIGWCLLYPRNMKRSNLSPELSKTIQITPAWFLWRFCYTNNSGFDFFFFYLFSLNLWKIIKKS